MKHKESIFKLIKQPSIVKIKFEGNNDFDLTENVDIVLNIKVKREYSNSNSNSNSNKGKVYLVIYLNKAKKLSEVPFILESEILGQFSWRNASEEEIEDFFKSVAPSIMLSYMRPIITNIITYSGFPPYIIPFLDLR